MTLNRLCNAFSSLPGNHAPTNCRAGTKHCSSREQLSGNANKISPGAPATDASAGFDVKKSEAAQLVEVGERIKKAAAEQIPVIHPENPGIHTINQALFAGPLEERDGVRRSRNAVIVSPGRIDRSPCGTGTSARLAVMQARGQIAAGETFIHESIIGAEFIGRVLEETTCGERAAIRPAITGQHGSRPSIIMCSTRRIRFRPASVSVTRGRVTD